MSGMLFLQKPHAVLSDVNAHARNFTSGSELSCVVPTVAHTLLLCVLAWRLPILAYVHCSTEIWRIHYGLARLNASNPTFTIGFIAGVIGELLTGKGFLGQLSLGKSVFCPLKWWQVKFEKQHLSPEYVRILLILLDCLCGYLSTLFIQCPTKHKLKLLYRDLFTLLNSLGFFPFQHSVSKRPTLQGVLNMQWNNADIWFHPMQRPICLPLLWMFLSRPLWASMCWQHWTPPAQHSANKTRQTWRRGQRGPSKNPKINPISNPQEFLGIDKVNFEANWKLCHSEMCILLGAILPYWVCKAQKLWETEISKLQDGLFPSAVVSSAMCSNFWPAASFWKMAKLKQPLLANTRCSPWTVTIDSHRLIEG